MADASSELFPGQVAGTHLLQATMHGRVEEIPHILARATFDPAVLSIVCYHAIKAKRPSILEALLKGSGVDVNELYVRAGRLTHRFRTARTSVR